MGRHRYRYRGRGRPNQRDTPVKAAPSRRGTSRRPAHSQRYEDIPEEPEEVNPGPVSSPAAPPAVQAAVGPEAFKAQERSVKVTTQNLTVTLGSFTSSGTESDTTFSSEEEEEEEEEGGANSSSRSLSSPEIFRREEAVPSSQEEPLGFHLHAKNSTLLDVSHAESIRMHHSPNLSNIIDASPIVVEKKRVNKSRGPEAETKIHAEPLKSEKWKTPSKLPDRKPLSYRKKVSFRSPLMAEPLRPRRGPERASFFDFVDDADRDAFFGRVRTRCLKLRSAPLFPLHALEYTDTSAT